MSRQIVRTVASRLREGGVESARLEARLLVDAANPSQKSGWFGDPGALDGVALECLDNFVERRLAHEPVAYITGRKEFWGLEFAVGRGALIPRPDTETLIEELLKDFPEPSVELDILDLGTGTGCLLVAALSLFPNARGLGIDNSLDALAWALKNVRLHRLEERCRIELESWSKCSYGPVDAVLTNPPYVTESELRSLTPEIVAYEPREALCAGLDGLDAFREFLPRLAGLLRPTGIAYLEIGLGQENDVCRLMTEYGLRVDRIAHDLGGIPRCIVARKAGFATK